MIPETFSRMFCRLKMRGASSLLLLIVLEHLWRTRAELYKNDEIQSSSQGFLDLSIYFSIYLFIYEVAHFQFLFLKECSKISVDIIFFPAILSLKSFVNSYVVTLFVFCTSSPHLLPAPVGYFLQYKVEEGRTGGSCSDSNLKTTSKWISTT